MPTSDAVASEPSGGGGSPSSGSVSTNGDWSVVGVPMPYSPKHNVLSDVACVTASNCWAVGSYLGDSYQTLIQSWDGISWAVVSSPNTSARQFNYLNSVTCVSASDCWAVGEYFNDSAMQSLIVHWDGTSWSIVNSPALSATEENRLTAVTCVSTSDCWAVGYYRTGSVLRTLIQRWDGTSWAIVASPNVINEELNGLFAVTCASASDCWAVGTHVTADISQTLIQRWDGTLWSIVPSPNATGTSVNYLRGVTCASASECWAVGFASSTSPGFQTQTLILHWDGTLWSTVGSPNPNAIQLNVLLDVSCVAPSDCWAVGYYSNGTVNQTLAVHWDGTSWVLVTSPSTGATQANLLYGLTCVAASDCWAVGHFLDGTTQQTLTEQWEVQSWTLVESRNVATNENAQHDVACASRSDCWTVGYYFNGTVQQTLIEHWNGTSWSIVTSPNTSALKNNVLDGVTCVSATDCWAVGTYRSSGNAQQTLVQHWNGISWSIVTSPNTLITQPNYLYDVACVAASDCWAVGISHNGRAQQTLIQHWDGTAWAISTLPNMLITQHNSLNDVTCTSSANCWAVGSNFVSNIPQTFIQHWDGESWTIVSSPNVTTTVENVLNAVTCASPTDCWAVGYFRVGITQQTLIERWDGFSWTREQSPNVSTSSPNALNAVTCPTTSDCWAAGFYNNDNTGQTLIQHWDGTSWAIVASPNSSVTQRNSLNAVTCASASDCWAVGSFGNLGTLVLRYTADTPIADVSLDALPVFLNASHVQAFSISGTKDEDASVAISASDGSTTVTSGSFTAVGSTFQTSLDIAMLVDGQITITANSTHPLGNLSSVSDSTIKDTIAPSIAIDQITNPIDYTNDGSVAVSGTAEVDASVAVVFSDGSIDTPKVQATISGTEWSLGADLTQLANGRIVAIATATDAAGNIASASIEATKNEDIPNAPTVVPDTLSRFATITPGDLDNDSNFIINVTHNGPTSSAGHTVRVSSATSEGASVTAPPQVIAEDETKRFLFNANDFNDGELDIVVTNSAGDFRSIAILDLTPSSVSVDPPRGDPYFARDYIGLNDLQFSGTATDTASQIIGVVIELKTGTETRQVFGKFTLGAKDVAWTADFSRSFNRLLDDQLPRTGAITAWAIDRAGQRSEKITTTSFTIL